jgi:hypothetical protein
MIAHNHEESLQPKYKIPFRLWGSVAWSLVVGRHRSILTDALAAFADGLPKFNILGGENIPQSEPCLVVCNHYSRPGFKAWWFVLGISAAFSGQRSPQVDSDIRWVMTSAWTFPGQPWRAWLLTPLTQRLFTRIAESYGFISMPPMPPAPHEMAGRAAAVLKTVRLAVRNRQNGVLIGLAPEGQDFETGFGRFPAGSGEFISLLVQAGLKVLPVGVCERQDVLVVSFGEGFVPQIPTDQSERDRRVSEQVIEAIKKQIG